MQNQLNSKQLAKNALYTSITPESIKSKNTINIIGIKDNLLINSLQNKEKANVNLNINQNNIKPSLYNDSHKKDEILHYLNSNNLNLKVEEFNNMQNSDALKNNVKQSKILRVKSHKLPKGKRNPNSLIPFCSPKKIVQQKVKVSERFEEIIKKNIRLSEIKTNDISILNDKTVPESIIGNKNIPKDYDRNLLDTPVENKTISLFKEREKTHIKEADKHLTLNKSRLSENSNVEEEDEDEINNRSENKKFYKIIPSFECKLLPQDDIPKYLKLLKSNDKIINYLDEKSLCVLALVNKRLYKISREILYNKIKDLLLNKNNNELQMKINNSLIKYSRIPVDLEDNQFADYLYNECKHITQIEKDLTRTITDDPSFKQGEHNYKSLSKILWAYANFNEKIGYCQGINFIVAYSLYLFKGNDKAVFCFFDGIVTRFNMEQYYGLPNSLHKKLSELGQFLNRFVPDLLSFLKKNSLSHEFFTANWVLTLFSNSINKTHLFDVWDFMFIFGWKFFNFFIASVLLKYKETIMNFKPKELSFKMKQILKSNNFNSDFTDIIKTTFNLMQENII